MKTESLYVNKKDCCGCEACATICPNDVIQMSSDEEGFYYPQLIGLDRCVECRQCIDVCPIKHAEEIHSSFGNAYAGHAKDTSIAISSSSGGFATVLAKAFIEKWQGIVYGVSYSDDYMSVDYCRIGNAEELSRIQTSKYSQARKCEIFKLIKEDIKARKVLFIGTPCDCYSLFRYLKNTENIYVVALICHGPTSEKVHTMFCEMLMDERGSRVVSFSLRHKLNGAWKPYFIKATFENGEEYIEQFDKTDYNTAFLYYKRPSCLSCRFRCNHFAGDLLIGDYHSANPGTKSYYEHGVSSLLPLTSRGNDLMKLTQKTFELEEVSLKSSIGQQAIHSSIVKRINRTAFTETLNHHGLKQACNILSIRIDKRITLARKKIRGFLGRIKRKIKSQKH